MNLQLTDILFQVYLKTEHQRYATLTDGFNRVTYRSISLSHLNACQTCYAHAKKLKKQAVV